MAEQTGPVEEILRHGIRDRLLHASLILTFMAAAVSGLALFHPALFFLSDLTGGGPWTALLHPFLGLAMMLVFLVFAAPLWTYNVMGPNDWQWLARIQDVMAHHEERVPEQGKYNAGQKLLYYLMVLCMLALLVTGFPIWRRYFAGYFPVGAVRATLLLHAFAAFALVAGIIGHVSFAIWVRGSIRSLSVGTVTLGWAYRHHRAWFRQMIRPSGQR